MKPKPLNSGFRKAVARKEGLEPLKLFCRQSKCKGAGLSFFQQWQQTLPPLLRSPCRCYLGMKDYTHSHTDPKQVFLMSFPCDPLDSACCRVVEVLGVMSSLNNRQVGSCKNAEDKFMPIFSPQSFPCCLGMDCPKSSEILKQTQGQMFWILPSVASPLSLVFHGCATNV